MVYFTPDHINVMFAIESETFWKYEEYSGRKLDTKCLLRAAEKMIVEVIERTLPVSACRAERGKDFILKMAVIPRARLQYDGVVIAAYITKLRMFKEIAPRIKDVVGNCKIHILSSIGGKREARRFNGYSREKKNLEFFEALESAVKEFGDAPNKMMLGCLTLPSG